MSGGLLDIFEIERFAIHDGHGIRTTVFMQGCPLRCEWCANPESQTAGRHIMAFSSKCTGCGRCAAACPQSAVSVSGGRSVIDRNRCVSCGKCAEICLNNAIKVSGKQISCEQLFSIVSRDIDYYRETGGGVTLSGGEALCQIDRLVPFLEMCRESGISAAFETCGHVSVEAFRTAMRYADQFLFDIKTLDESKFHKYTGGSCGVVKAGFEFLCENVPEKVTVRVPVIPGFNDGELFDIMEYTSAHGVRELHLLPYHTLGISKYEQLGMEYRYPLRESLDPQKLQPYAASGIRYGLDVKIGG